MMPSSSAKEGVSRWMVGPVDVRMTVHAPASVNSTAGRRRRRHALRVVNRGGMTRADMTALAEHRRLGDQQTIVRRTMRIVARHAALATRRMLPEERSPLFGVTADTRLVDVAPHPELL